MVSRKGYIHVLTGDGGGKTTSALGVAMRSLGQGNRVAVVQFMKGRKDLGEVKIQKMLGPKFEVFQFGRKQMVNMDNPADKDIVLANQALGFSKEELFEKNPPDLLILDEINVAAALKMIDIEDVLAMLKRVPRGVDVYLTGRRAPRKLMDIADFVTVVTDKKRKNVKVRKGIDY